MELDENTVMELIIYAGEARSGAMEALRAAREHDWEKTEQMLSAASVAARKAHHIQTALIGADEGRGKIPVNLILVHAQDHLMSAMLCRDLVEELVYLHRELAALKQGDTVRGP
ncbi:PTS lactose/cellobiose transporter subunit IIA [Brenneria roseae subsp. roseae]|uniref:PTS lactose/cellobiose transporter subunit IIA n=1 Tax=Brenneria roseae TaxID=1509241 RepID=UPI000D612DAC|nr:PTS lactose/cellobiose transporter subunit IIA [Brenneria roseae]PWC19969.1 PTS lactose/cellobiose transporter subunit IIA [Brenneria roseae subsp. roseae]